jgi:serine/threonine-protein kinase RsbW
MVNNAIHHGNRDDRNKKVYIKLIKRPHQIDIVIRDDGGGFDPNSIADPLDPENLFKESGRGIFIVKSLMDDVKFEFNQNGTEVTLIKHL